MNSMKPSRRSRNPTSPWKLFTSALFLNILPGVESARSLYDPARRAPDPNRPVRWGPPEKRDNSIPLVISNQCGDTIWPGIASQAGTGPGTGGFALESGTSNNLLVSTDWQGRIWGRTNCSFNVGGTGPSNLNGNNGGGAACGSGDCAGVLSCVGSVSFHIEIIKAFTNFQ